MLCPAQWEFTVWLRKLKQGLCIKLKGWDVKGFPSEEPSTLSAPVPSRTELPSSGEVSGVPEVSGDFTGSGEISGHLDFSGQPSGESASGLPSEDLDSSGLTSAVGSGLPVESGLPSGEEERITWTSAPKVDRLPSGPSRAPQAPR